MALLLLLICFQAQAQTLYVTDSETGLPLEGASVICTGGFTFTNTAKNGHADISALTNCDSLVIQLIGYESRRLAFTAANTGKIALALTPANAALNEVVVSATRWSQYRKNVPQRIATIQPREIALQQPQTAADMLSQTGEVFVQKSQLGGGSPMIRGFAANRVLIVVDGVRMNNAIFRSGNLQNVISVDPFVLERAEVLFGPGAVQYGSDAIGGVMNFQMLYPRFSRTDSSYFSGSGTLRYSTANQERTGHLHVFFGRKRWAFVTSISRSDFADLRMGKYGPNDYLRREYIVTRDTTDVIAQNPNPLVQKGTGYSQGTIMQKVRFSPNIAWDLTYTLLYSNTSNIPRYDRLAEYRNGQLRFAQWFYGPQKWLLNSVRVSHAKSTAFYNNLTATATWQQFGESRHDRRFQSAILNQQREKVNAYTLNLDAIKLLSISNTNELHYGVEALQNKVRSTGNTYNFRTRELSPGPSRYPSNATYTSMAGYAAVLLKLNEKTTLQAGTRYTHTIIETRFDTIFFPLPFGETNLSTGALNGNLGLAYRPTENWQLNAQLATGFRAPNIDDVGKIFESAPGAVVVPNPGLKPEYAYSAEAGITRLFGTKAKADITGYYTYLDNALVRRNFALNGQDSIVFAGETSRVQAIQNAAHGYIWGVQASAQVTLPHGFGLEGHYNYQRGEEEDESGNISALRHAAPAFGLVKITYTHRKIIAEVNTQFNGEIANSSLALSEQDKPQLYATDANGLPYSPAWQTLNAKLSYRLNQHLRLNLGLENITDERYRTYSSGIAAPGRNFMVSASATW